MIYCLFLLTMRRLWVSFLEFSAEDSDGMAAENITSFPNSTFSSELSNTLEDVDEASTAPRMAFLALFIVVTLVGNTCMIIVILPNKKYRKVAMNLIIVNMAVLNVYDSLANMPVVFGSLTSPTWQFDKLLCQFNTFSMSLVIVETVLTIFVLIIDRFIAIKATSYLYKKLTGSFKVLFVIIYTWIQSVGFSLPFLIGAVPSKFQHELNLCTISDPSSLVFICFTSVFCFLVPTVIIFMLFLIMFKKAYKKRSAIRAKIAHQNYSAINNEQPELVKHIAMAKYAAVLFTAWFIFECPYIVTTYIKQFQYSEEIKNNPGVHALDYSWLVDVTFLFVRFSFSSVLPVLTFLWRKDFWQTWKDTVLCRRNNSVTDVDTLSAAVVTSNVEKKENMDDHILYNPSVRSKEKMKVESSSALSFNIPVLFATSNGIHVETSDSDIFYTELDNSRTDDHSVVKGKKLDVEGSLEYVPPDTSDYDSNSDIDEYSVSQPISSARLEDRAMDSSARSASQPQVQTSVGNKQGSKAFKSENIADVYGTDSGLDLSSGHRSCEVNSPEHPSLIKGSEPDCMDAGLNESVTSLMTVEVSSTNSESQSSLVKSFVSACDCFVGGRCHQCACHSGSVLDVSQKGGGKNQDAEMVDSEVECLQCCHSECCCNNGILSGTGVSIKGDTHSLLHMQFVHNNTTSNVIQKDQKDALSSNGDRTFDNDRFSGNKKEKCCIECSLINDNISYEGRHLAHKPLSCVPLSDVHHGNKRTKPLKKMSYLAKLIPNGSRNDNKSFHPGNCTDGDRCAVTIENTTCSSTSIHSRQSSVTNTPSNGSFINADGNGCSSTVATDSANTTQLNNITVENISGSHDSIAELELFTKEDNNTQNKSCSCDSTTGMEDFTNRDNDTPGIESSKSSLKGLQTSARQDPSQQKGNKKRKKHRRQRTADSQKALLGSGSSSELQAIKSALGDRTPNKDNHQTLDSLFQDDSKTDGSYQSSRVYAISGNTAGRSDWTVAGDSAFSKWFYGK